MRTSIRQNHGFQPRQFGRGKNYVLLAEPHSPNLASDIRLFATTFAAGFLFVSLYLA
jgi:hypothetical protein